MAVIELKARGVGALHARILLPLDGSAVAETAVPFATAQAVRFRSHLILIRVVEPIPLGPYLAVQENAREQRIDWARDYLESVATSIRERGIPVRTVVVEEAPHVAIIQYAEASGVDLIVLCSRGHSGRSRWLMGSVADRVVRGARVPVLLVQP